jgi:hypothetical protein
LSQATSFAT